MKNVPTLITPHFGAPLKWIQQENLPNGEIVVIIGKNYAFKKDDQFAFKKKPASTGSNIAPILIFPFFPLLNSKTVNGNFVSRARSLEDTCPCVPRTECPWSVELLKNRMKLSKYHPSKKIITKYINAKVCDASTQNVECCGFKLDLPANPFYKADVNTQNPEKVML